MKLHQSCYSPEVCTVPEFLVVCSLCSSIILPTDILLDPATSALKTQSVIRLHKLATIHGRKCCENLGFSPLRRLRKWTTDSELSSTYSKA